MMMWVRRLDTNIDVRYSVLEFSNLIQIFRIFLKILISPNFFFLGIQRQDIFINKIINLLFNSLYYYEKKKVSRISERHISRIHLIFRKFASNS